MSDRRWISYAAVAGAAMVATLVAREWVFPGKQETGRDSTETMAGDGPCPDGRAARYWKAPMDPSYVRDGPGKSPMGMDLVPVCPDGAPSEPDGRIRIDPATVQNIGVRVAEVSRRDLARKIRAVGRVTYDERLVDHVHTKVQGWLEHLYVEYEGEAVKKGQRLLEIYSPELVSTQEELLLAARYRRSTENSPFEDVSEGGAALFEATRRRLELWDISRRDIDRLLETGKVRKTLTLYAPSRGVVTHLMVRRGMEVGPKDNLYTISDLSRVWVYANLYEYELPWIEIGQRSVVELSYLPGERFEGEVTYVYPFLDPKTRTARVRIELPNPDETLKPDMFANVTIESAVRPDVVVVPEEAVIRSGRRSLVILALGEGLFEPRDIELGLDSGDGWLEVISGLDAGEQVVVSSQFLIDSESRLQAAVRKLLGARSENPGESTGPAPTEHGGH